MLTTEHNDLLTRVSRGTPMGQVFRSFWLPFLFSWELDPDGEPERVRLLGENLVAFRDTDGRVGLLGEHCPHRGASLFFGRNERQGLACMYHGWKYDTAGRCVDMPSEPDASNFKDKVRHLSYPVVERGGVVWTYMGTGDPPQLPDLEWMHLPEEHWAGSKRVQYSNWLQGLEGEIDQSHVSFAHSQLALGDGPGISTRFVNELRAYDRHPRFEVLDTDYGVCIGSGRQAPNGQKYWRVTQFLLPSHIMTGPYGEDPIRNWRAWVPIDDVNVFVIGLNFHPLRPLGGEERERYETRSSVWNISPGMRKVRSGAPFSRWHPLPDLENNFLIDRERQRSVSFSGIEEFWAQDAAPQLSMGPIYDRTAEHLGTSDLGIITVRKRLTRAVSNLVEDGVHPPAASHPEWYRVRSDAVLIPAGDDWIDATAERRRVDPARNPDCV